MGGRDGEATIIYTGVAAILFNQYPEVSLKRSGVQGEFKCKFSQINIFHKVYLWRRIQAL